MPKRASSAKQPAKKKLAAAAKADSAPVQWAALVRRCAAALGRSSKNVEKEYLRDKSVTAQLGALGPQDTARIVELGTAHEGRALAEAEKAEVVEAIDKALAVVGSNNAARASLNTVKQYIGGASPIVGAAAAAAAARTIDGVEHLKSKVLSPKKLSTSACIDITDLFGQTGKCDVDAVVNRIRSTGMWMRAPRDKEVEFVHAVKETLDGLWMVADGVDEALHDQLVERFDALQGEDADSLLQEGVEDFKKVETVQWGDADDEVQKRSRRSWMMTEEGMRRLRKGGIQFYASVHKENAAKGAHPNHLEFHKECLNATYRATANDDSLLGFNADLVEETVEQRLHMPRRGKGHAPLLSFQFNSGQGAYVLHGDDPGDPYPNDPKFIAGGGGFGSTVANVTLRKGATIVFEVYCPAELESGSNDGPLAAVSFHVKPGSVWAMKAEALYQGAHGVLPDYLKEAAASGATLPDLPVSQCRISLNLRYGQMPHEHCQWYWSAAPGNEAFKELYHDGAYEDDEGRPSDTWKQKAALPVPENWKDGAEVFTEL